MRNPYCTRYRLSNMQKIACFLALLLRIHQASGFAPIQPWLGQRTQHYDGIVLSSLNALINDFELKTLETNQKAPQKLMDPLLDLQLDEASASSATTSTPGWSYGEFAKTYPNVNNICIATVKTASADLLAQVAIAHTPVSEIDWQRALMFCAFGATYSGAFQYWYQVNIFKKLFNVDKFTSQPWGDKLKDTEGLKSLAAQTVLDLGVLTLVYLPTFYVFKAGVFSGSTDLSDWLSTGLNNYSTNFDKDEFDLIGVWAPADLVCFSVPLYARLPVRHIVSFVWTAYLSSSRGGH